MGKIHQALERHRELLRFALVGGVCFVLTLAVNYTLKFTVLTAHPVTAQGIAVLVATIVSYVLSREWSFSTRGGRRRPHEAALFFLISGISLGLNALPLAISRYVFTLRVPEVQLLTQEVADFLSGMIIGTLLGSVFRWWAMKKWVFPLADARPRTPRLPREPGIPQDRAA
ncbi:GtrA family protein [Amycolatopsis magusensis]|uniref:Flippase GtrA n=1 Tax=Amycolatopsis magusensis TaxID=882444 RepID=A0ABS4PPF2_9PSEU|nr:GtrA family protein [Amycolatopsis magusensis]MBP2180729.1 putative flippase GtrA [Amycolatopsis magusensis]MDI5981592.1 GtrA family protein [Amycolatopsis magusensis]